MKKKNVPINTKKNIFKESPKQDIRSRNSTDSASNISVTSEVAAIENIEVAEKIKSRASYPSKQPLMCMFVITWSVVREW